MSKTEGALQYMKAVQEKLQHVVETQINAINHAATTVENSIRNDGMIYLFGTGHSHMLAEEGHYRAGGLVPVCPILATSLMLHEGAVASSAFERTMGIATAVLQRYNPKSTDTIIIFSNSGVNAVPVEMALAAKSIGMTVMSIVSLDYAQTITPIVDGKRLADVADIVIDNCGIPGDALIDVYPNGLKAGPLSTIACAFILNAILVEASIRLGSDESPPPVYISSNIPGATKHNQELIEKYRSRNPHL